VETPLTLTDVEALAAACMDPHWSEYLSGGAGAERTLADNILAFTSWRLRQRVLCGIESVSTAATVLGHPVGSPVVVAPVAYQRMAHTDGEEGMARAAAAAGSAMCLSTFSTASVGEVAAAAPDAVRFLQVYVFRDHGVTDELIAQALDAGFSAIFLTVDLPVVGARDRERRIHWTFQDDSLPAVRYALERGVAGEGLDLLDPALDWAYLERLVSTVKVPVVVKGILEPEDAVLAAEHGAAGVVVSNHGGRQLDGAAPTLEALPAIVAATGDRLEVLLDGGIRRGTDVAMALALGANAVLVGRMPLWGLAARGEDGARIVLELLREELAIALHLMGCRSIADLTPDCVARVVDPSQQAPRIRSP
jgi:isopentenyl diphosphate isomerase/L-lactate dehydrogenase-like FMN-dependent dehydrogenase